MCKPAVSAAFFIHILYRPVLAANLWDEPQAQCLNNIEHRSKCRIAFRR